MGPVSEHPGAMPAAQDAQAALAERLAAVGPVLGTDDGVRGRTGADHAVDRAGAAARAVLAALERCAAGATGAIWPLLVAVAGAYPDPERVHDTRRRLELQPVHQVAGRVIELGLRDAAAAGTLLRGARAVTGRPVVDVGFSATSTHHTGIQRVVRELIPRWEPASVELAAWDRAATGLRGLDGAEAELVLRFRHGLPVPRQQEQDVLVPHATTIFLPEVPGAAQSDRLLALAALSTNTLVAVGYDCIPVVDADKLAPEEPVRFTRYLAALKHAESVLAISAASARQFEGWRAMLSAQGLSGPRVQACPLPTQGLDAEPLADETRRGQPGAAERPPEVVAVGSHEPRKNQLTLLRAAERLWAEGHRFSLRLLGTGGWASRDVDEQVRRLQRRGREVRVERGLDDRSIADAYGAARFTVFVSVHEGFGLPVVESLAAGTPVLTAGHGSTAEVADGGGAVLVDPRDPDAVADAMRRLLTDDRLVASLREQASHRAVRTWDEYAREVAAEVGATMATAGARS